MSLVALHLVGQDLLILALRAEVLFVAHDDTAVWRMISVLGYFIEGVTVVGGHAFNN